ncbi:MAG TPA: DoxX family membrane protein [Vicinamibacterales bacterium]
MTAATRSTSSGAPSAAALRLLSFMLGLFFVFNGLEKVAWFTDSGILGGRLDEWLENAPPLVRWYIETMAAPGVPLFARIVPLAELSTGAALIVGFWTRLAAFLALMMVANLNFARGMFHSGEFLTDGVGFPVTGALLALVIAGSHLPFSATK